MSPLPGWRRYRYPAAEPIVVAVDETTGRCEVIEGELQGKRFSSPSRAVLACLAAGDDGLVVLPDVDDIAFPGGAWEEETFTRDSRQSSS